MGYACHKLPGGGGDSNTSASEQLQTAKSKACKPFNSKEKGQPILQGRNKRKGVCLQAREAFGILPGFEDIPSTKQHGLHVRVRHWRLHIITTHQIHPLASSEDR
eukprot:scaffold61565_cov18-Tisochrysis_lutea.AAC.1